MVLKMDIRKDFNTLNWDFLLKVLHYFGFSAKYCHWIANIPQLERVSILVNGFSVGYFFYFRGVR